MVAPPESRTWLSANAQRLTKDDHLVRALTFRPPGISYPLPVGVIRHRLRTRPAARHGPRHDRLPGARGQRREQQVARSLARSGCRQGSLHALTGDPDGTSGISDRRCLELGTDESRRASGCGPADHEPDQADPGQDSEHDHEWSHGRSVPQQAREVTPGRVRLRRSRRARLPRRGRKMEVAGTRGPQRLPTRMLERSVLPVKPLGGPRSGFVTLSRPRPVPGTVQP